MLDDPGFIRALARAMGRPETAKERRNAAPFCLASNIRNPLSCTDPTVNNLHSHSS
jgi:hypothetical protein